MYYEYVESIKNLLQEAGVRVELDSRNEKLGYKMRESQVKKIPMTLVLGDKEKENSTVNYRLHGSKEATEIDRDEFVNLVVDMINDRK